MQLEYRDMERVNKIRTFIMRNYLTEKLKDLKCDKCNGTGLSAFSSYQDGNNTYSSWDCKSFCDKCSGIGFLNVNNINDLFFVCKRCNGTGIAKKTFNQTVACSSCHSTGYVDWLTNLLGQGGIK